MGGETIAFERELAQFVAAPNLSLRSIHALGAHLSLLVSGVGKGDEVICPSLTWCSTANAALYLEATPVLCDVDPETLSVSTETVPRT